MHDFKRHILSRLLGSSTCIMGINSDCKPWQQMIYQLNNITGIMLHTLQCSLLDRLRSLEELTRQRVSGKLTSWNLGVLITRIVIPYPRATLVYGSTCSLLVLFYYKCLLRLNSDIAKPSPVFQCPRKSLSWQWAWNSVRMLPIQWHSELSLVLLER